MSTLVLKNATIIDGTGGIPFPTGRWCWKMTGSRRFCGFTRENSFGYSDHRLPQSDLLPGLIDGHVHLGAVDANIMEQQRLYHPSMLVIRTLKIIQEALDQGFTTVRDAGGADAGFREAHGRADSRAADVRLRVRPLPDRRTRGLPLAHRNALPVPGPCGSSDEDLRRGR